MEFFSNIATGFGVALTPINLAFAFVGCLVGTLVGVLPGIVGSIQALEAIKMILELGDPLVGRLLTYDAMDESFRTFKVRRDPACPACGESAGPIVIAEYDELCMPHAVRP